MNRGLLPCKIVLLMALMWVPVGADGQRARMNLELHRALTESEDSQRWVSLLVEGAPDLVANAVRELGGHIKFSSGSISSVSLPLTSVPALGTVSGIRRIEGLWGLGQVLDDKSLENAWVLPVHQGIAPLEQGYDGNGVILAFLDSGIDFRHPDFKNSDGSSRILYLWDQYSVAGGTTPQPYNYGQEWDAAAIDAGQCGHYPGANFGHGTNVAGIAAGNALAVNNYLGVAPKADIIAVSIAFNENFLANVVDAVSYSFSKAAQLGKPCVINASIGTYMGSHDGYDLPAQLINNLLDEQGGRSFVCAAGNAATLPFHLGYAAEPDSAFTWFKYQAGQSQLMFQWWIDKQQASGFYFCIGVDNTAPFQFLGRTPYYHLPTDFDLTDGFDVAYDTLYYNNNRIGTVTLEVAEQEYTYSCWVSIKPDVATYYWRFMTRGSGSFDLWSSPITTGTAEMVTTGLPSSSVFPDINRYRLPDTKKTLVSSFACSDHTITVANYVNRKTYLDFYGNLQIMSDEAGAIALTSSWGPTRDNRQKPDLAAPGNTTLTAGELGFLATTILYQPFKVALGGLHNRNGGTSMAAPVVAGIAALYLQQHPQATWKQVKDALALTAFSDNYTGNALPDFRWGHGKVHAFAALTTPIVYGCTNPASLNFNPDATVDDGSCIPIVFGCTDPNALNFDPDANIDDGSCQYEVGINPIRWISSYRCQNLTDAMAAMCQWQNGPPGLTLEIATASGRKVYRNNLPPTGKLTIPVDQWAPGLYFCYFSAPGMPTTTQKLMVFH